MPDNAVEVGIDSPCGRRSQAVAVEVFHITHGEIKCAFVDFLVLHLEVDEEFLVVVGPCEVEIGQLSPVTHRGIVLLVGMGLIDANHQGNGFFHLLPLSIPEDALVCDGEDKFRNIVLVAPHL